MTRISGKPPPPRAYEREAFERFFLFYEQ
jgi:hypothetical protein